MIYVYMSRFKCIWNFESHGSQIRSMAGNIVLGPYFSYFEYNGDKKTYTQAISEGGELLI